MRACGCDIYLFVLSVAIFWIALVSYKSELSHPGCFEYLPLNVTQWSVRKSNLLTIFQLLVSKLSANLNEFNRKS